MHHCHLISRRVIQYGDAYQSFLCAARNPRESRKRFKFMLLGIGFSAEPSRVLVSICYPAFRHMCTDYSTDTMELKRNRHIISVRCRKVVLATNIAETSITIPGIRYVIELWHVKEIVFSSAESVDDDAWEKCSLQFLLWGHGASEAEDDKSSYRNRDA